MSMTIGGMNNITGTKVFTPNKGPFGGGVIIDGPQTNKKPHFEPWICEERPKVLDWKTGEMKYKDELLKNNPLICYLA